MIKERSECEGGEKMTIDKIRIEKKEDLSSKVQSCLDSMDKMTECWELGDKYLHLSDEKVAEIILKEGACAVCKYEESCKTSLGDFM